MIKVENTEAWGFEHSIRGMRNPKNSWNKSDTTYGLGEDYYNDMKIGENDLKLMKQLYKAGTEHRKYLRQIIVSLDITAPLYWWKEFDTYKVGTVANSCSTMHKIQEKEFTINDFSCEHLSNENTAAHITLTNVIASLEATRLKFLETKDKKYWWQMIQLLPSSYNQKRTVTMNYKNVFSMIKQRTGHKLDEWNEFVSILKELPYVKEIGGFENELQA